MDKKEKTVTWVCTIATKLAGLPLPKLEQFEFEYPLRKVPTHTNLKEIVRGMKKWNVDDLTILPPMRK
jgi:hypothetical protein